MTPNVTSLERAYQLARSGKVHSLEDIKRSLAAEGYNANQIEGRTLRLQLKGLINRARTQPSEARCG